MDMEVYSVDEENVCIEMYKMHYLRGKKKMAHESKPSRCILCKALYICGYLSLRLRILPLAFHLYNTV